MDSHLVSPLPPSSIIYPDNVLNMKETGLYLYASLTCQLLQVKPDFVEPLAENDPRLIGLVPTLRPDAYNIRAVAEVKSRDHAPTVYAGVRFYDRFPLPENARDSIHQLTFNFAKGVAKGFQLENPYATLEFCLSIGCGFGDYQGHQTMSLEGDGWTDF